ncbi:O-antigen ligase family protein [Rossellomorea marisflavi]|uniref:O-antigen ligase family protein n=1 Tax=Rossellomorea marisflavi TaxID=189381 RepID=UPI0009A69F48|nr:O-antigen ligase family protein [Rossellomorea marisflavi]
MIRASRIINILWILLIVLIPFTSFPFKFFSTAVSPISAIPLTLLTIIFLFIALRNHQEIIVNKVNLAFILFALITVINSLIPIIFSDFSSWKGQNKTEEFAKSTLTILIPIFSLYVGSKIGERIEDINKLINIIFISFLLPMIFGFLQILNSYILAGAISDPLFRIFTLVSQGYLNVSRISLLTLEPSWAANLLVSFYIPIFFSVYSSHNILQEKVRKKVAFGLLSSIILLLFTKSAGGIFTFMVMLIFMILKNKRMFKNYKFIFLLFIVFSLLLFYPGAFIEIYDRILRVLNTIFTRTNGVADGSAAVRSTYWLAGLDVFKSHPIIGVGWGNSGFYFKEVIPDSRIYGEVAFYLNESNNIIPNAKNIHIRILAESGIIGAVLFFTFIFFTVKLLIKKNSDNKVIILQKITALSLISWFMEGFSLDTFGFLYPWLQIGLLSGVIKKSVSRVNYKK